MQKCSSSAIIKGCGFGKSNIARNGYTKNPKTQYPIMELLVLFVLLCLGVVQSKKPRPSEDERVELWKKTNTWPPTWQPETRQYKLAMQKREEEIMSLTGADERWENWLQFTQARLVPKFTSEGFKVVDTPPEVHARLAAVVNAGVANFDNLPTEGNVDVIYNPPNLDPKFVEVYALAGDTLKELKTMHEDWAGGIELKPTSGYGVRLYQNGSSLVMHNDRVRFLSHKKQMQKLNIEN